MMSFSRAKEQRSEIERQIAEFKARGGEIKKIPAGVGQEFQTITQKEANKRAKGVKLYDQTGV